jgi:hypothetical protein
MDLTHESSTPAAYLNLMMVERIVSIMRLASTMETGLRKFILPLRRVNHACGYSRDGIRNSVRSEMASQLPVALSETDAPALTLP